MSDNHAYLLKLCQDLHNEGKQPSLALVRARSAMPLSLPEVIHFLKRWKAEPEKLLKQVPETPTPAPEKTASLEQRVYKLEQQVAELSAALQRMVSGS